MAENRRSPRRAARPAPTRLSERPQLLLAPMRETQSELLQAARLNRPHARARLVESFMPLIGSVARIYAYVPAVDRAELIQEGVAGVLRALERYDPDSARRSGHTRRGGCARRCSRSSLSCRGRWSCLTARCASSHAYATRAARSFAPTAASRASTSCAAESELTLEQLHRLSVADRRPRGLEEPLDDESAGGATFGDSVRDPRAEEAYDAVALRMAAEEIPRLLTHLSERERRVIDARYGLCGPERTLRELGDELGISAERTRQIEQAALETMRLACQLEQVSRGAERAALAS